MWRFNGLHGDDMVMILKNVSAYYCLEREKAGWSACTVRKDLMDFAVFVG